MRPGQVDRQSHGPDQRAELLKGEHGCPTVFAIQDIKKPRVNFTNVLRAAFALVDPKSAKKDSQNKQLFCAFGI